MKLKLGLCEDKQSKDELQNLIESLDMKIAEECAEENFQKIKDNFQSLSAPSEKLNNNGMWNLMKKVFPKNAQTLPVAKKNNLGQIITNPEMMKDLYLETFVQRLRHRPIKTDFEELKKLKETLFELRLSLVKKRKSKPWSMKDLDVVLKSLKKNKSRDPHGLINELFKPGIIGSDLKDSLLVLLNGIKSKCHLPEFIQWANITAIYKGKGEKIDLENERGIFGVTLLRSILMKLIYNDKYEIIDSNMSDSNVGARKRKNIRNHIFVINGIIHDVLSTKNKKSIDIQILDYKQCFDSMWLKETMNDLFEAGVQDDQLGVLFEANKEINLAIKTPNGLTDRVKVEEIILQGDVFGPMQCSVTVDSFGKECILEDKHLYYYKDEVPVPILTMVDDALAITECGYEATMMNAYLNTKTNIKKLQYGVKKCYKMHVGKKWNPDICPDLHVDGWKMETVTELETGLVEQNEEYAGIHKMKEVVDEKYLGDIVSSDGKNQKNIQARKSKGIGVVTQIMTKLDDICFGKYFFQVALIWRNTYLISSLLTNAEAWYNVILADIDALESVDEGLLRKILEAPMSTPIEMLYLELGVVPIRFIIKERRLNFLWYLLNEDKESLVNMFLTKQLESPVSGDWGQTCLKNLEELNIQMTIKEIEKMPEQSFRKLVRKQIVEKALEYLNKQKGKHSKVLHLNHPRLETQSYLEAHEHSIQESRFLFALRSRMVDVKANYREKYFVTLCPCCNLEEDCQEHLLSCYILVERGTIVEETPDYEDLFCGNLDRQINIARILKTQLQLRNKKENHFH